MGYKRSQETKKRNERLYAETMRHYGNGVYFSEKKGRYIRYWQPRRAKYIKRKCNRAVRRYKGALNTKGAYRKVSEYWWEIW